jgi:hypothetical protein
MFDAFPYRFPLCFVVGHEVRGVAPAVLDACEAGDLRGVEQDSGWGG